MKRMSMTRLCLALALAVSAIATTGIFAGSASASGPAPPGKELVEVECAGVGTITIAVPRAENSKGAGQIVGQKGHGIPVAIKFTLTDVTTDTVLFNETRLAGGGHAHSNQATTSCTSTFFEGPAATFFKLGELPPHVGPNDVIRASTEVQVIPKT